MATFDLKECLQCSDEAFLKKFGRVSDIRKLENKFSGLKGSEKGLTYKKIKELKKRKYWDFSNFWMIPSWLMCWGKLKATKGLFKLLPDTDNERNAAIILYDIFKNIEVVSVILRLVDPENYGIISPPVRCALGLKAKDNYVDEYLDYISVLRMYAKEYKFERVADADIALWTLVEKCLRTESPKCENFQKYQEKMVEIEEEYIRKSQLFHKMEEEILGLAKEELAAKQAELDKIKEGLRDLKRERESIPQNLITLEKSLLKPEAKIIHDRREPEVDAGQKHFMYKLAEDPYINQIIWSENIKTKRPTRISNIQEGGELTILYVNKDNYAAKIKVRPVRCPDRTHARFFANLVAKLMNIPLMEEKKGE